MAGGIFKSQNKVRPGSYINFKSLKQVNSDEIARGITTIGLNLSWGEEDKIIEINNTDLYDGTLLKKLGYSGHEPEMQVLREALKNAYKVLVFRLNTGTQAIKTTDEFIVKAKCKGTVGNAITVSVKALESSKYEITIYLRGLEVDKTIVSDISELKAWENDFLIFDGEIVESAGIQLEGATDSEIEVDKYSKYFNALIKKKWDTIAAVGITDTANKKRYADFIKKCREEKGKYVQLVINDYSEADYEGVISVKQGYITKNEIVTVDGFIGFIAGLTAASRYNVSNTYYVLKDAIGIVNEIDDDLIESEIKEGHLILNYRQDEKIVIEKDINTLTTFTDDKNSSFSKNRVIRTLDHIGTNVRDKFEKTYIGKVDNNDSGRGLFKGDLCADFNILQDTGAIKNFIPDDIIITEGNEIDSLVIDIMVQPVDAMEKLYMTVLVR